jgi:DNA-nicking Smr family endonuclease
VAGTVKPYQGKMTTAKKVPEKPGGKKTKPPGEEIPAAAPAERPRRASPLPPAAKAPALNTAGFDRATATKLKKGKMPLEGRIDLHGMTQSQARSALHRFVAAAVKSGKRTVLVITGKGRLSAQGGVLRRMLPLWLEDPALGKHVIALTPAAPKDGGSGAFYLRLRKRKEK